MADLYGPPASLLLSPPVAPYKGWSLPPSALDADPGPGPGAGAGAMVAAPAQAPAPAAPVDTAADQDMALAASTCRGVITGQVKPWKPRTNANVVVTCEVRTSLSLATIVRQIEGAAFSPASIMAVKMKMKHHILGMVFTVLIFATGKIVCVGAPSAPVARACMWDVVKQLSVLGYTVDMYKFTVQNIVGSYALGKAVDLNSLVSYAGLANVQKKYLPNVFRGMIIRNKSIAKNLTVLQFGSGSGIIAGAPLIELQDVAYEWMIRVLNQHHTFHQRTLQYGDFNVLDALDSPAPAPMLVLEGPGAGAGGGGGGGMLTFDITGGGGGGSGGQRGSFPGAAAEAAAAAAAAEATGRPVLGAAAAAAAAAASPTKRRRRHRRQPVERDEEDAADGVAGADGADGAEAEMEPPPEATETIPVRLRVRRRRRRQLVELGPGGGAGEGSSASLSSFNSSLQSLEMAASRDTSRSATSSVARAFLGLRVGGGSSDTASPGGRITPQDGLGGGGGGGGGGSEAYWGPAHFELGDTREAWADGADDDAELGGAQAYD